MSIRRIEGRGRLIHALVMFLLAAALTFGPDSGPALAEHTVIQEEVTTIRGCQVLHTALDVSQGYPIILTVMSCAGNAPPTILLSIRPKNSPSASSGMVREFLGGSGQKWYTSPVEANIEGDLNTVSLDVLGDAASGYEVRADFVHSDDGMVKHVVYKRPLSGEGSLTGSSTVNYGRLNWPADCAPKYIGVTSDGAHHAGWCGGGLHYLGPNDQAPTWLGGSDEVDWPWGGEGPFALGITEEDPFAVILGAEELHYFGPNQDGWETGQEQFPSNMVAGQTAWVQADGTTTPEATVFTPDEVIRWEGPDKAATYWGEIPCKIENASNAVTTSVVLKSGPKIVFLVVQCPETGFYFVRVFRVILGTDEIKSETKYADLEVEEVFGGMALVGARADHNAGLHVLSRLNDQDAEGNPRQREFWTNIVIKDLEKLPWKDLSELEKK